MLTRLSAVHHVITLPRMQWHSYTALSRTVISKILWQMRMEECEREDINRSSN